MTDFILKDESYKIAGSCVQVHTEPGMGFREIVYKDSLEYEFINNKIPYHREKNYKIFCKGHIFRHSY